METLNYLNVENTNETSFWEHIKESNWKEEQEKFLLHHVSLYASGWSWVMNKRPRNCAAESSPWEFLAQTGDSQVQVSNKMEIKWNVEIQINSEGTDRITTPYRAINGCVDVEQETWAWNMRMKTNSKQRFFKEQADPKNIKKVWHFKISFISIYSMFHKHILNKI